jgi:hypothetical protein
MNTIILNNELLYPRDLANYKNISSNITGYNNLQIATDTDNNIYYKINSIVKPPATLDFPAPVLPKSVITPETQLVVPTGGPARRGSRSTRTAAAAAAPISGRSSRRTSPTFP